MTLDIYSDVYLHTDRSTLYRSGLAPKLQGPFTATRNHHTVLSRGNTIAQNY